MSKYLGWKSKEAKAGEPFHPNRSSQTAPRAKWDNCVHDVKSKNVKSPYGICTTSVGKPAKKEAAPSAAPFKAAAPKAAKAPKTKSAHMHLMKRVKDHIAKSNYLVSKREAEQSTAAPQLVRGKSKESAGALIRGTGFLEVGGRFLEKSPGNNIASARVVLIQEGLGNLKDGYFYTKEALQAAADNKVFEGKKMYADHPNAIEEKIQPERSTRDIVGHYEDVAFEESEDGTGMLTANLLLMRGDPFAWVHSLVERAVDYSKKYANKQFIGLSINASGEAEPMDATDFLAQTEIPDSAKKKVEDAILEGLNEIKVVRNIQDAVSVDLVTEAGAKGKILELLEAHRMATKDQKIKESEAKEKKEAEEAAKEAKEAAAKEGDDADAADDGDHDDADADKELIMKMLKKQGLLGDDADEEECKEAMEAGGHYMAAFKKQGHESEAAATHAAAAMKAAADVHAAMHPPAKDDDADDKDGDKDGDEKPAKESHKEAKAMLKLEGEVASLRESVRKYEIREHLETKLKESKLPTSVTKRFREAVANAKSIKEIDEKFNLFLEGFKLAGDAGFVTSIEKGTLKESNNKAASSLDDCVEEA